MADLAQIRKIAEALAEIPVLDVHTHLVGGKLGARGLHDILLYHMVVSDLYAAGCPNGARLTEFPGFPGPEEAARRIQEVLPYLPRIRNTVMAWVLRQILSDLYAWNEPLDDFNWRRLDAMIRERGDDRDWQYSVLDRAGIRRSCTELARRGGYGKPSQGAAERDVPGKRGLGAAGRGGIPASRAGSAAGRGGDGEDDARLEYALEWGFFTRAQWGEFDTALYELERCWGQQPESPMPISAGQRPEPLHSIRTVEDVHSAVDYYMAQIPYGRVLSTATHISTDIDFRPVSAAEMQSALDRRAEAGVAERDIYASYVNEAFLTALEAAALKARGNEIVFQFSFGAEPLPHETASRLDQRSVAHVAEMIARHPGLRFQCFLASLAHNQSLCTLARELPNLSLAGYWWHNFFPAQIAQVMAERLDMLPVNKQIGFFSDAYCLEWSYGKLALVRGILAQVLAERIERGQYSFEDAVGIAREILFESPQSLLGMKPRE